MAFAEVCADPDVATSAVIKRFHRVIAIAGYTFAVGVGESSLRSFLTPQRFYFNSLPRTWMALLSRHADIYAAGLNGSKRAAFSMEPFESLSLQHGRILKGPEKQSYDLTTGYGWRSIFVVPVHGPAGYRGTVAMLAKSDVRASVRDRAALRLAALCVHDRCRLDAQIGMSELPRPALSAREIACLHEVTTGGTDKDIARKFSLKPSTVHDHIERARRKLNAKTRAHAASLLVLTGLG